MDTAQKIRELESRLARLESLIATQRSYGPLPAASRPDPVCAKCGIRLPLVMSYVCSQAGCPAGLGGTIGNASA